MAFLAEAYLHRLDPFAIRFPAGWIIPGIRWYGLAYLAGFLVGWLIVRWLAKTHRTAVPRQSVADLMIYVLIGVLVGGRLGYCVFYDPSLAIKFTSKFPFWGLLAINEGGMSSHGGMIGVVTALWIFAVRNHLSKLHLFDVAALACTPGLFFGRVANFVNHELWGTPLGNQADPPWWSVKYPQEILESGYQHGAALETLRDLVPGGETFRPNVVQAAIDGNAQVIEVLRPLLTAYHPSQLYQALTDGPVLAAGLALVWWGPRKPGVVGSCFLIFYAVMRLLTEVLRQPDAGVAVIPTPLGDVSRGQALSLVMLGFGIVGLLVASRREVEPIGGLVRTAG